jgi:hypothetical protein
MMRKFFSTLGALALLAGLPAGLAAQDLAAICTGLEDAEVGDWAEYQVTSPQGSGTMRFAMLPKGAAADEGQWFEMSMNMNEQAMVLQLLVGDWPFDPDDIEAVVMKPADQPAMRVPDMMLGQLRGQMNVPMQGMSESCRASEMLGQESVTVPAGTFSTHRLQPAEEDAGQVWVSSDVPFGLVKGEGPEGSMILVGTGHDATTSITETPQDMPGMPGMGNQ